MDNISHYFISILIISLSLTILVILVNITVKIYFLTYNIFKYSHSVFNFIFLNKIAKLSYKAIIKFIAFIFKKIFQLISKPIREKFKTNNTYKNTILKNYLLKFNLQKSKKRILLNSQYNRNKQQVQSNQDFTYKNNILINNLSPKEIVNP